MQHLSTDLNLIIKEYLADIAHTRKLIKNGKGKAALIKLSAIESSLHTQLAMYEMGLQMGEHIDYDHRFLDM